MIIQNQLVLGKEGNLRGRQMKHCWKTQTTVRPTTLLNSNESAPGTNTRQFVKKCETKTFAILGLSEERWLQAGQIRSTSGETLLYSGPMLTQSDGDRSEHCSSETYPQGYLEIP
jgi:hypothetical protein